MCLQSLIGFFMGDCRDNRRVRSPPRRDYFSGGGPRGGPPMEEEPTMRVYVHNLSYKTSWQVWAGSFFHLLQGEEVLSSKLGS